LAQIGLRANKFHFLLSKTK